MGATKGGVKYERLPPQASQYSVPAMFKSASLTRNDLTAQHRLPVPLCVLCVKNLFVFSPRRLLLDMRQLRQDP